MRFVVKPDKNKTAKLSSEDTYNKLLDIAINVNKNKISDSIYRDTYNTPDEIRSRVEDQLMLSYLLKCAYCERICKADIEHYRPKGKVDEDSKHHGYYWLCYEWTNLLPACVKCNRDGGKHSKFPIYGKRVYLPSFNPDDSLNLEHNKSNNKHLLAEEPFLLHPEIDDPEKYFDFKIDPKGMGIRINGIDGEGRGNSTIEICLLNRQELKIERARNVILPFKKAVLASFNKFQNRVYTIDRLIEQLNDLILNLKDDANEAEFSHTLLRKYIVKNENNFKLLVLPFLPNQIHQIILTTFQNN